MAQINLLPWREELREEKKREFSVILIGVVIIAAGILFLADRYVNGLIEHQQGRNDFLNSEIAKLEKKLAEIKELKKQKQQLTERMIVIQDLQGNRPVIVRVFDQLVRTLPQGVYYDSLRREGDIVFLQGVADSSSLVSALMRNLDASEWFSQPNLSQVQAVPVTGSDLTQNNNKNGFSLSVVLTTPKAELKKQQEDLE